ncbi:MAG: hypothetical protein KAU62_17540 [Candidatus Heimdallarchaeota archaeon]|nr:hypothetical protein [Candidatus Heimdallarchaeota archaeon]MCG3257913.1 hypothetical protein [Candidatus Heimdallarchaeota archaeon]MCK4612964.1 hypothetical protein [Candidatus Heimdallarchaeota archaeon]
MNGKKGIKQIILTTISDKVMLINNEYIIVITRGDSNDEANFGNYC